MESDKQVSQGVFIPYLLGGIFSVLSTGILLYVSLTTGLGPWIAPTLVLLASSLFRIVSRNNQKESLVITQTIGSVGGAIAVAVGFSYPTLYFLDQSYFLALQQNPLLFSGLLGCAVLLSGFMGIWFARLISRKILDNQSYQFPVSQVIYQTIDAHDKPTPRRRMLIGFSLAALTGLLRDGFRSFSAILPQRLYIGSHVWLSNFVFELSPMFWAIGFIAGTSIVLPLVIGMLSKYLVVYPLLHHANYLPIKLFEGLTQTQFVMAFCSGIVLYQAIMGLFSYPKIIKKSFGGGWDKGRTIWRQISENFLSRTNEAAASQPQTHKNYNIYIGAALFAFFTAFYSFYGFPYTGQVLLFICTLIGVYQIMLFGARTGLAPYGRFMTFAMLPLVTIYHLSPLQITLLCLTVGVASAAGVDLLFDYKVGQLANISEEKIYRAQVWGLLITAVSIGGLFWLLCNQFQLGSASLIAHRGMGRALLLQSINFNTVVLLMGMLYGALLKYLRINPTLAFGGLLMPNQITIGLLFGALLRLGIKKPEQYFIGWSGVFAGESLWIFISLLGKLF